MTLADIARRAAKLAIDNSPTILTTVGVAGFVTTTYLAGKASFEAADLIRLKEGVGGTAGDPKERIKERVQLVWKLYIPTATMLVGSAACVIGGNRVGARRAAALAAGFTITERAFEEYKAKVVEKIGERKEEQVRADIIQDRVNANWDDSVEVHGKPQGQRCYDKFSDRYVWDTVEGLRSKVNDLNASIIHVGYATLADFYHILDMPAPAYSYEIGWSADRLPRLRFSSVLTPANDPVLAFEFDTEPVRGYNERFH